VVLYHGGAALADEHSAAIGRGLLSDRLDIVLRLPSFSPQAGRSSA
jgi:hypothetical protein